MNFEELTGKKAEMPETPDKDKSTFFEDVVSDDEYFSEFSEPVQEFEAPPEPEPEPQTFFEPEPEPELEIIDPKVIEALNRDTADMIVSGVDIAGSFLLSNFVAKSDNPDDYKLPKQQKEKIIALIQKMMPTGKTVMPNWMLLALTITNAYGELTAKAVLERQVKQQAEKIKELEAKIKEDKK